MIIKHLKSENFKQIHHLNRAQLIDDAFNLARVGSLDYLIALDLMSYLSEEIDYAPWYSAFQALTFLNDRLVGSDNYSAFKVRKTHLNEKKKIQE